MLIPAWQPDHRLLALIADLSGAGFGMIVVVNDGSDTRHFHVFREAARLPRVLVLEHPVNLGKGRALKTGLNYLLNHAPPLLGVVTADADGQHLPADICRVAETLLQGRSQAILGVRSFSGSVPLRSGLGNSLTRGLFTFLTGAAIADTQTGLRGFAMPLLPQLLSLAGERYEYEMTVLAHLCRTGPAPQQVPISTVYLEGNRGSHFHPVWDSMRITFVLLRFYASSLLSAGLDLALFAASFALWHDVLLSVSVGRMSSLVNFWINRQFVFQSTAPLTRSLPRYYLLAVGIGATSYGAILALHDGLRWPVLAAKICADILLSLISFAIQRGFIFRNETAAS